MKRYRFYFCISEETQNCFSLKAHRKRLCSSSKAARSSLNFLFLSVEGGEVETTITTLRETKTMLKPRISTDESVTGALFAELGKDNDDAAMEILRSKSLDSKGLLTPRTRVYIASGEWDAKDRLIIKFMLKENCWGRIGTAGSAPDGADRFCGKYICSVAIHKKALVDGDSNRWYIQA
jgi:hypothetical protein